MGLERNEEKHISCAYQGHESDCPKVCSKCAISIKASGDAALMKNCVAEAISQYKKAVFAEPKFAEAWYSLANAYGMRSEYHNALSAYNKALAIDPQYGKAMFGKAIALRNLGKPDTAMALANEILELYDDENVHQFKADLKHAGIRDTSGGYSLQKATQLMTDKAFEIIKNNDLLSSDGKIHIEGEMDCKEAFAQSMYAFCQRRYNALGNEKVWSEAILSAFYGAIYTTLMYYREPECFTNISAFSYLTEHVNLEELDRNAEKVLGISSEDDRSEKIWNIIYAFVTYAKRIIECIEPTSDIGTAVKDAAENACVMGMLLARQHQEQEKAAAVRAALNAALERLAESTKDYNYTPPQRSAMCYSVKDPVKVPLYFQCDGCGHRTSILINESGGREQKIIEQYEQVAAKFTKRGYPAKVKCFCNQCADQNYPSGSRFFANNFVFSILRPDRDEPIISFPSSSYFHDFAYRVALEFLKGADTIEKLSETTNTELSAETYLGYVHEVLGDVVTELGYKK